MNPANPWASVIPVLFMVGLMIVVIAVVALVAMKAERRAEVGLDGARALGFDRVNPVTSQGLIDGVPAELQLDADGSFWLSVGVTQPPRFVIHRDGVAGMIERFVGKAVASGDPGFDGRFVVTSAGDKARAQAALKPELRRSVKELFDRHHARQIDTVSQPLLFESRRHFGRRQVLRVHVDPCRPSRLWDILQAVVALAKQLEGVPLHVVKLGAERRAERSSEGRARCAWCHEDLTGSEPDLVACEQCSTVLHEGCWAEQGGCPTLGCTGKTPERAKVS